MGIFPCSVTNNQLENQNLDGLIVEGGKEKMGDVWKENDVYDIVCHYDDYFILSTPVQLSPFLVLISLFISYFFALSQVPVMMNSRRFIW